MLARVDGCSRAKKPFRFLARVRLAARRLRPEGYTRTVYVRLMAAGGNPPRSHEPR